MKKQKPTREDIEWIPIFACMIILFLIALALGVGLIFEKNTQLKEQLESCSNSFEYYKLMEGNWTHIKLSLCDDEGHGWTFPREYFPYDSFLYYGNCNMEVLP